MLLPSASEEFKTHYNKRFLISRHRFLQITVFEFLLPRGAAEALAPCGTEACRDDSLKAMGEASVRARTSPFPALFPLSKRAKALIHRSSSGAGLPARISRLF